MYFFYINNTAKGNTSLYYTCTLSRPKSQLCGCIVINFRRIYISLALNIFNKSIFDSSVVR